MVIIDFFCVNKKLYVLMRMQNLADNPRWTK